MVMEITPGRVGRVGARARVVRMFERGQQVGGPIRSQCRLTPTQRVMEGLAAGVVAGLGPGVDGKRMGAAPEVGLAAGGAAGPAVAWAGRAVPEAGAAVACAGRAVPAAGACGRRMAGVVVPGVPARAGPPLPAAPGAVVLAVPRAAGAATRTGGVGVGGSYGATIRGRAASAGAPGLC